MVLVVKNLPANAGDVWDMGLKPWVRKIPGGGHDNPLQYSYLENLWTEPLGGLWSIGWQRVGRD